MIKLQPKTWNAHNINDGTTYTARFTIDSGLDALVPVEAVVAQAAAGAPKYQRRQVKERRLILRVQIVNKTQANAEQLLQWFDPSVGEVALVASPDSGNDRQLNATCISRSTVQGADWLWEFALIAADGRWQTAESTTSWTVASSGATQAVTNSGTTPALPRIRIKPHINKAAANGWIYRRRIFAFNRANQPLACPNGAQGYPLMLLSGVDTGTSTAVAAGPPGTMTDGGKSWATNEWAGYMVTTGSSSGTIASNTGTVLTLTGAWTGGTPSTGAYTIALPNAVTGAGTLSQTQWNHKTLVGGSKSLSSGDDVLVFVDGAEWPRYVDSWNADTTKLWASIMFPPTRGITSLFGTIGLPNNGTTIATQPVFQNISHWPASGFLGSNVDAEILYYSSRDDWHLYDLRRAQLGTSYEAWGGNSVVYPLEHDIQVFYGYTGAGLPELYDFATDLQPLISLSASTNVTHKWTTNFWSRKTRKSRQFVPEYKERNAYDVNVSLADATAPSIRDTPGQFKKNALTVDCPVPIEASSNAITHDVTVPATLKLDIYGQDLSGNSDVLLASYLDGDDGTGKTITPASDLSQLRYEAHITSVIGTITPPSVQWNQPLAGSSSSYTVQTFTLADAATLSAIAVYVEKTATVTRDCVLSIRSYDTINDVPTTLPLYSDVFTIADADITGTSTGQWIRKTFATPLKLPAGRYSIFMGAVTEPTEIRWGYYAGSMYAGGEMWTQLTGSYTRTGNDLGFRLYGTSEPQDPPTGAGDSATIANLIVNYDMNLYTPRIHSIAEAGAYLFYNATLSVQHPDGTVQTATIKVPCAIDEEFEIDCENKTIEWVTTSVEVVGRSCAHAVSFDDEEDWLRLDPGSNTFTYTEAGMASSGVVITIYDKDTYG